MNIPFLIKYKDKIFQDGIFLGDLSWSFFGLVCASGVMFIVNVMFGRNLGPEQYGIASFILLATQTLRPIFTNGIDMSMTKELANANSKNHSKLISASFLLLVSSLVFYGIIISGVAHGLRVFNVRYDEIIIIIFVMILIIGMKMFFEGVARGLGLFKQQAVFKIVESIMIFCVGFIVLFVYLNNTYEGVIFTSGISMGIIVIGYFIIFKKYIKFKNVRIKEVKMLFKTGILFASAALVTSFILLSDRVLIGMFLDLEDLGIYSAYAVASITIAGLFVAVVNNVLFVHIARDSKKKKIVIEIDKIFKKWFIVFTIFLFILVSFIVYLYGDKYEYNIIYSILFSIVGSLSIFVSLYSSIITTYSNKVFKYALMTMVVRLIFLGMYYWLFLLLGAFSIEVILIGLILDYIFGFISVRYIISKYII